MELIIDRNKWLRGEGSMHSYLYRPIDGKMCCLGFFSLACGLTPDDIRDEMSPVNQEFIALADKEESKWLFQGTLIGGQVNRFTNRSEDCGKLISLNDELLLGLPGQDEEREVKIAEVFAKHGITVKFVG